MKLLIKIVKTRIKQNGCFWHALGNAHYLGKKSGVLSGGGLGVTFGAQKQTLESDKTKFYAQGSQVGSLNGNTTLIAENHYSQTASQVSAVNGDVNILAKNVDIKADR